MIEREELIFSTIIGHESAVSLLRRAIARRRVAHAYLFVGPEGVGKRRTAYAFAAALLCKTQSDEACGQCASCRKLISGNHPDFLEIIPVVNPKTGKPPLKIRIDNIRKELIPFATLFPVESPRKIIILQEIEEMTIEASNALLKTLEEPSASTILVLVSSSPQMLLPTILSRCQKVVFGALPVDCLAGWLRDKKGMEAKEAVFFARLSEGSIGRALTLDRDVILSERPRLGREFYALTGKDAAGLLDFAQELTEWPQGLDSAFEMMKTFLADALRLLAGSKAGRLIHADLAAEAADFSARYTPKILASKIRSVSYAQRLLARNANKLLTAEALLLDVTDLRVTNFAERMPR